MTYSKHSDEAFHTFKRHDDSMYKLALLGEAELQLRHWEVMKLINIASSLRNRSFRCTVVSIVALGRYRNPYRLINTLYFPCTELGIMNKRIGCTNWRRPHEVWRWSLAQNEIRKILCSSQLTIPIPPAAFTRNWTSDRSIYTFCGLAGFLQCFCSQTL